jgi:hypothetical protein
MRTGSGAPLGEISKLMNMDSVLAVGVESFHWARYFDWGLDGILAEGD